MIAEHVHCTIERRLLVSYRIEPTCVENLLPAPFRPQVVDGCAVGGVCFLRLGDLRPPHFPHAFSITTENAAHRLAVEWDDEYGSHAGVYIPRRDTDSRLTAMAGGRLFPGRYNLANFKVAEAGSDIRIDVTSADGRVRLAAQASETERLESGLFENLDAAVSFFRCGALGFAPSARADSLDGVRLEASTWAARPARMTVMESTVFDDQRLFPAGSCELDSALIMRDIPANWITTPAPSAERKARAA